MNTRRVYADFQNLDDANRLRLTSSGTLQDLERQGIELEEGLVLTFYTDDEDDLGHPDELRTEGVTHYDVDGRCWVATIDWSAIRHGSDEDTRADRPSGNPGSEQDAIAPQVGSPVARTRS